MRGLCLILFLIGTALHAEEVSSPVNWSTDLPVALASAQDKSRLVLVRFSGSDWNPWCRQLQAEIFSRKPFLDYARERLLLVVIDFPRERPLPPELAEQNAALVRKYSITVYPTLLLLTPDGAELGRVAYIQGGAKTFVRELRRLAEQKPKSP